MERWFAADWRAGNPQALASFEQAFLATPKPAIAAASPPSAPSTT